MEPGPKPQQPDGGCLGGDSGIAPRLVATSSPGRIIRSWRYGHYGHLLYPTNEIAGSYDAGGTSIKPNSLSPCLRVLVRATV